MPSHHLPFADLVRCDSPSKIASATAKLIRPGRSHEARIAFGKPGIREPLVKSSTEWPNCAGKSAGIKPIAESKESAKAEPDAKSKPGKKRIARAYWKPPNGTETHTYAPAESEE
jgi:hypothetical protein